MLYSGRHVLIRNIEDETQITVNACKISIYHGWPLDECKRVSNSSSDATVDGVCVAGVRRWASPQVITSLCSIRQLIPTLYFAIFWWEGFFNSLEYESWVEGSDFCVLFSQGNVRAKRLGRDDTTEVDNNNKVVSK